jgi:hypothetical protein
VLHGVVLVGGRQADVGGQDGGVGGDGLVLGAGGLGRLGVLQRGQDAGPGLGFGVGGDLLQALESLGVGLSQVVQALGLLEEGQGGGVLLVF